MKNTIFLLISLLLFYFLILSSVFNSKSRSFKSQNNLPSKSSISVYSTPELYELTARWASEYSIFNPDADIKVIKATKLPITQYVRKKGTLGFTSAETDPSTDYNNSLWKEIVGRDIIVMVFNSENPFIDEICEQGISPEGLAQIMNEPGTTNWGTLLETPATVPVNLYMTDDASINSGMAKLLNLNQIKIDGIRVEDGRKMISSVQNDPYSIGICKITSIIDFNGQSIINNIKLLPLDRNDNGKVDNMEDIYDDLNVFLRAVWAGKYPEVLAHAIYSVSLIKPTNKTEIAFLKWVLSDGQKFLNNYGYSNLVYTERLAKVNLLEDYTIDTSVKNNYFVSKGSLFFYIFFPIILVLFIILVIMVISGVQYLQLKKSANSERSSVRKFVFDEDFIKSPQGLYYDKTHTWAFMEEDGIVKIGIDDFLQHITGPLTSVKMKPPGERIKKGKQIFSIIQAGKQLDIYAPFSGTIKEQNQKLSTNTSILNSSPYIEGWVYKIEPTNWLKEIQFLFMGNKYKEWLKTEYSRLREFFTDCVKPETAQYAQILQDGGEIKDGILVDFGPEVWEDFQTSFIDVSS